MGIGVALCVIAAAFLWRRPHPATSGNWIIRAIDAVPSGTVAVHSWQACGTSARNGSCAAYGRCHGVGPVEDGRSSGPDNHLPDAAATPPHQR